MGQIRTTNTVYQSYLGLAAGPKAQVDRMLARVDLGQPAPMDAAMLPVDPQQSTPAWWVWDDERVPGTIEIRNQGGIRIVLISTDANGNPVENNLTLAAARALLGGR